MKVNILHVLTLIFVIAKITGYINWSWWIVLLPTLIPIGLSLIILLVIALAAIVDYESGNL